MTSLAAKGEAGEAARKPTASSAGVLTSLALCTLLPSLGTSSANVALPTLAHTFDASIQQVQWVVLAYLLSITSLVVVAGRLGDMVGRRRLLGAGILVFAASSVACGLATELWMLVAARAVQGIGAAAMVALTMAFVGSAVPKARSGTAMGVLGTMSAVGTASGPSLGGVLIDGVGWPAIFLVNVPLAIAGLVLVQRHLPPDGRPSTDRAPLDVAGALLLAVALAAYALAMTFGRAAFGAVNVALLVAAAIGVALFVRVEAHATAPLIQLARLRDARLMRSLATSGLVATVMMATLVVGPFYLGAALGLGAGVLGAVLSMGPLVAAVMGVPGGRLVDRFGARSVGAIALGVMLAGCAALVTTPATLGIPGYVGPIVALTAGYAVFQAANNSAVMANVSPDERGVVAGLLNLSRNLGLVTGASAMGAVYAFAARAGASGTDRAMAAVAGMKATFALAALLLVVALVVALGTRTRTADARGGQPL